MTINAPLLLGIIDAKRDKHNLSTEARYRVRHTHWEIVCHARFRSEGEDDRPISLSCRLKRVYPKLLTQSQEFGRSKGKHRSNGIYNQVVVE